MIAFYAQITVLVVVVLASIINISLKNGPDNLWTMLLSTCLGIVLPNPRPVPGSTTYNNNNLPRRHAPTNGADNNNNIASPTTTTNGNNIASTVTNGVVTRSTSNQ